MHVRFGRERPHGDLRRVEAAQGFQREHEPGLAWDFVIATNEKHP